MSAAEPHIYIESSIQKTNYDFNLAKKERKTKLLSILNFLFPEVWTHPQLLMDEMLLQKSSLNVKKDLSWLRGPGWGLRGS